MKKTIITLAALAASAVADTLPPLLLQLNDINVATTTSGSIDSIYGLNTTDGVTAMISVNWTSVSNAPLFWLGTDDGSNYTNSVATMGYKGAEHHASLFNNTNGSNGSATNGYNNTTAEVKTPDYIADLVKQATQAGGNNTSLKDITVTYFMVSQGGSSSLYEVMGDNSIQLISSQGGMKTGNVTGYHVGQWGTAASQQKGTLTVALYGKALSEEQMHSLVTPEPATATLSLLALAGLASRRRRK